MELFTQEEIKTLSESVGDGTPIWQHWERFCHVWAKSRKSTSTVRNVRDAIRTFALYGGLTTIESWNDPENVFDVMHRLEEERRWSESTFNSYRKNVNTYFLYLKRRRIVPESPLSRIEKMREVKR